MAKPKISNQEAMAAQQEKRRPGRPKKVLTEEERAEKLRVKREKDAERQRNKHQRQKQERLAAGEATVFTPEQLQKIAIRKQQRYQDDEEYREKIREKAREYQRRKRAERKLNPPAKPQPQKPAGRPRKHVVENAKTS